MAAKRVASKDPPPPRSPVRIRFREDVHLEPDKVHVEEEGENPAHLPEAHVGLLLVHHTYQVVFPVSHDLGPHVLLTHNPQNICVTTKSVEVVATPPPAAKEGAKKEAAAVVVGKRCKHSVCCDVKTPSAGHLEERIELSSEDGAKKMVIVVTATVIALGKGNPLLKDGVKCIGHDHTTDDSELSDWHGHKIIA